MPNIKSSIRSVKTDAERRAKNFAVRSALKNASRKLISAIDAATVEDADAQYKNACSVIDKAAADGVIHKNAAARRKSRLAKKLNALKAK